MGTTVLTLIFANSKWGGFLFDILFQPICIGIGSLKMNFTLLLLVNDGLMTIFFLVVGLELKREILVGELSSMQDAGLPILAASGGMIVPALIYYSMNHEGLMARGWGIAMATDIAFAVGILVLLAGRIPRNLIIFLTALAIADDLGAVLVIALFYTSNISLTALGCVAGSLFFWYCSIRAVRVIRFRISLAVCCYGFRCCNQEFMPPSQGSFWLSPFRRDLPSRLSNLRSA